MVRAQLAPPPAIDPELDGVTLLHHAAGHIAEMDVQVARFLYRVAHCQLGAAGRKDDAAIANLAAGLRIKRRLVDDQRDVVPEHRLDSALAVPQDRQHHAFSALGLVAEELGGAELLTQGQPYRFRRRLARSDPAFARLLALARHRCLEALDRHPAALCAQYVLGEVEREAVGVVQSESNLAGQGFSSTERRPRSSVCLKFVSSSRKVSLIKGWARNSSG